MSMVIDPYRFADSGAGGGGFPVTTGLWSLVLSDELALSNLDTVSTWADQSGEGNDWIAPAANREPLFLTNFVNGLPAVEFNHSGNVSRLEATFGGAITYPTNPHTIMYIVRLKTSGRQPLLGSANNSDFSGRPYVGTTSSNWSAQSSTNLVGSAAGTGTWHCVVTRLENASTGWIDVDGVRVVDGSMGHRSWLSPLALGSYRLDIESADAYFAAAAVWNRGLSSTEAGEVWGWAQDKYGLT